MSARVRLSAVAVSARRGTSTLSIEQRPELAVVRAEIVAPLADAMRLVDRDEREVPAADQAAEGFASGAFWSDIEQVELAGLEPLDSLFAIVVGGR